MEISEFFPNTISKDFFRLICGGIIGRGCFREVYECNINTNIVIKFETDSHHFHNINEWEVWNRVCYTEHSSWLAECIQISPCGTVLMQKRTDTISTEGLPKFIPEWLTDTKKDNWGLIDNKPVCHDYGYNLLIEKGLTNKVIKANWKL